MQIHYKLCKNVCQMIADTEAQLSILGDIAVQSFFLKKKILENYGQEVKQIGLQVYPQLKASDTFLAV